MVLKLEFEDWPEAMQLCPPTPRHHLVLLFLLNLWDILKVLLQFISRICISCLIWICKNNHWIKTNRSICWIWFLIQLNLRVTFWSALPFHPGRHSQRSKTTFFTFCRSITFENWKLGKTREHIFYTHIMPQWLKISLFWREFSITTTNFDIFISSPKPLKLIFHKSLKNATWIWWTFER